MKTNIRPATYDDLDLLIVIAEELHNESPRFSRMKFCREKILQLLIGLIDMENGLMLVAEVDGTDCIVGFFGGMVTETIFTRDLVANDIGLFITPAARGGSLAARMIKEYIEWAQGKTKFVQISVSTGIHMEKTAELYKALGLKQYSMGFEVNYV